MPGVRDVLARFRPAGTPGPAAPAGVPSDRRAVALAELEPVFAALAGAEAQAAAVREAARETADRRRAAAADQARSMLARARAAAGAERAAAAAARRRAAAADLTAITERAARTADTIRRRSRQQIPDLSGRAVALVRRELGAGDPVATGPP
jgi:hypothetical protein